ncbi:MAG TPA: polysaccharide deacetylase family protein [Puia sp.]|jgi:hypothetical protein|nr:polysaccharide deacetylase family protein [Puia sp.]
MTLYCPDITSRLRWIIGFCSDQLFDVPINITSDRSAFERTSGPRINYSTESIPDAFTIRPAALLFETEIKPQSITCFEYNGHKALFPTGGDLSFDLFAASFYLMSRYEEWLPHEKDVFGRFAHTQSLACREGFLEIPLVNYWLLDLRDALGRKYPDLVFRYTDFKFIPTYDIDSAWSYLHKGWQRNLGGAMKSIIKGEWQAFWNRTRVLQRRLRDPFDAYEWLDSLHLYCRLRPYYFFLVASRRYGVDRNISPSSPALRELIQYHASGYRIGIHPSWRSGDDDRTLREEIEWLEVVAGHPITRSRQHFIRFHLPDTYRQLLKYGIRQDFSMGYGSINGFRASVACSYYWYDLGKEETTDLRIFPFCFMDANSYYEQRYTAPQAMSELMHYYRQIRAVNGIMVTIWHNNFLGSDPAFAGWREVYEVFLKEEIFWYGNS